MILTEEMIKKLPVLTEEEMTEIIERAIRESNNEADRIDEEYDRNTLN